MTYKTLASCEDLISRYINDRGGEIFQINEGALQLGDLILYNGKNAKTFVFKEIYINCWSSGMTVRGYNKMPKKYQKLIDNG